MGCGKKFSRNSSLREHERNIHEICSGQRFKFLYKEDQPNTAEEIEEDRSFNMIEAPLDINSKAQVKELISLFQASQSTDFRPDKVETSLLPKDIISNLLDSKRTATSDGSRTTETLPSFHVSSPPPVTTLPTLQSSLYSLLFPNHLSIRQSQQGEDHMIWQELISFPQTTILEQTHM